MGYSGKIRDKYSWRMCKKKRKLKSSEASRLAARVGQRKYLCPLCGHWHLTKAGSKYE